MTEADQIFTAVAASRPRLPHLAADYAERAIAAGKTVAAVKGDLFEMMCESPRERGKANMRRVLARMGVGVGDQGNASATSTPSGVANMAAQLRRQGIEPRRG